MTDLSFESEFESTSLLDMPIFFRTITEIFRKMEKEEKRKRKKKKKKRKKKKREREREKQNFDYWGSALNEG